MRNKFSLETFMTLTKIFETLQARCIQVAGLCKYERALSILAYQHLYKLRYSGDVLVCTVGSEKVHRGSATDACQTNEYLAQC